MKGGSGLENHIHELSTFEKIPFEVQWGEGNSLDGWRKVRPVLTERNWTNDITTS